jgi:hypothetical protein
LAALKRGEFRDLRISGRIFMKDSSGTTRVVLGTDDSNAAVLSFLDSDKEPRLNLGVNNNEPVICLYSRKGEPVVSIRSEGDTHSLRVFRTSGAVAAGISVIANDVFVLLIDQSGTTRAELSIAGDDVNLALCDSGANDRVVATCRAAFAGIIFGDEHGQVTDQLP